MGESSRSSTRSLVESKSHGPVWLGFRSSVSLIATVILVAFFTDGFVYGIVVPVLPYSLHERSGVPEDQLQFWSSTLLAVHGITMFISSLGAIAVAGFLADRSESRRAPFLVGLALTFAATILFAVSRAPGLLILARSLQGASAGIVYTVGLALLVDTVGRESLGTWMGFVMIGFNMGILLGPILGGIIYTKLSYWPIFVVVLVIVAIDFLLRTIMIEKSKENQREEPELPPTTTTYGSVPPFYDQHCSTFSEGLPDPEASASSETEIESETDNVQASLLCSHSDPTRFFFSAPRCEQKGREKIDATSGFFAYHFPVMSTLLSSRRLMASVYGSLINTTLTCAFDSVLPIFVKKTFGWNPTATGLVFLTIALPAMLGPLAGALADRSGPKIVALSGFAVATPAVALLGIVLDGSVGMQALLCILLTVFGLGSSAIYAPLGADMSAAIDDVTEANPHLFKSNSAYAQAFSLFDNAIALGTICGPVLAGFVYQVGNWWIMNLMLAIICASGALPVMLYIGTAESLVVEID